VYRSVPCLVFLMHRIGHVVDLHFFVGLAPDVRCSIFPIHKHWWSAANAARLVLFNRFVSKRVERALLSSLAQPTAPHALQ